MAVSYQNLFAQLFVFVGGMYVVAGFKKLWRKLVLRKRVLLTF